MPGGFYPVMFIVVWVILIGVFQRVGKPESPREQIVAIAVAALIALAAIPVVKFIFWITEAQAMRYGVMD